MRAAIPDLWRTGIVAFHNANDTCDGLAFRTYQELKRRGELGVRVLQQIPVCNLEHAAAIGLRSGLGDAYLRVGGIKMFADGALGSRTASMLQPYEGEPGNWGVTAMDPEEMLEAALLAGAVGAEPDDPCDRRPGEPGRAEHPGGGARPGASEPAERARGCGTGSSTCRHPRRGPAAAGAAGRAGVRAADPRDLGHADRGEVLGRAAARRGAYAFRRLLDSGAHLVFGSDGPIEPHDPLIGIHAAVTRRRADGTPGPEGWQGQERISVAEAVDAYTYWPAYAAGEEGYRGSITPGKVADLVVLAEDIFAIEPMRIRDARVEMTVIDGKVMHSLNLG